LKDLAAEIGLTHEAIYRAFVGFVSKAPLWTTTTRFRFTPNIQSHQESQRPIKEGQH